MVRAGSPGVALPAATVPPAMRRSAVLTCSTPTAFMDTARIQQMSSIAVTAYGQSMVSGVAQSVRQRPFRRHEQAVQGLQARHEAACSLPWPSVSHAPQARSSRPTERSTREQGSEAVRPTRRWLRGSPAHAGRQVLDLLPQYGAYEEVGRRPRSRLLSPRPELWALCQGCPVWAMQPATGIRS